MFHLNKLQKLSICRVRSPHFEHQRAVLMVVPAGSPHDLGLGRFTSMRRAIRGVDAGPAAGEDRIAALAH